MKKLLVIATLVFLAGLAFATYGYTSLLFIAPCVGAVLYGANGSIFVETPHVPEQDIEGASVHWNGKNGHPYINRDGKTYEMTRKGWKYNWASKLGGKNE